MLDAIGYTAVGTGVEELVLEDAKTQRSVACELRKTHRERRRRLVEQAVQKIKDAADDRLVSAVVGGAVQAGVAAVGSYLAYVEAPAWKQAMLKIDQAAASAFAEVNPWELSAVDKDAEARQLQGESGLEAEETRATADWLQSARELERRMLAHLEKVSSSEHQANMEILRR